MIIPINAPAHSEKPEARFSPQIAKLGSDELVLIELQGSFHVEGDPSGQLAARLNLDNEAKPTLLIGHNLLEGKVLNLSKPLAVLYKKGPGSKDDMHVDEDASQRTIERTCEYDVIAIVRRKVLFSKRPMPIVNLAIASADATTRKQS